MGSRPALQITKKGALDSQPQVIKFTSCRHDIAEILLKVALNTKNQSINQSKAANIFFYDFILNIYFTAGTICFNLIYFIINTYFTQIFCFVFIIARRWSMLIYFLARDRTFPRLNIPLQFTMHCLDVVCCTGSFGSKMIPNPSVSFYPLLLYV